MNSHPSPLRPLMLVGTGSDVGKSVLCTALCRILLEDGYHPAPFKAQNMALNSYATPEGLEIGRAQAVQAEACRLAPHTDMNPLLLKPNSEHTTQVVLNGKPIGNRSAYEYFRKEGREPLRVAVHEAYDRLAARHNPIILEGAGSVSEINLRESDLVNMPMARYADAAVILVADIDRGGVFASCYGSIQLQTPEDRARIKGIIINKFRGDIRLFDQGRRMMEDICGVPVLGVIPAFKDIHIEAEDSVVLDRKILDKSGKQSFDKLRNQAVLRQAQEPSRKVLAERDYKVQVAVVLLHHLSNFTDFDALERDSRVNLIYTSRAEDILQSDLIILPGTKSTLDDLYHLRLSGLAGAILQAHREGKTIVGICGGFQMLGKCITDPAGIEGSEPMMPGLGLLDMETLMTPEKKTQQVSFYFGGATCQGYEIHQGVSRRTDDSEPLPEVVVENGCIGTYIHGFLDNPTVLDTLLQPYTHRAESVPTESYEDFKQRQYDLLAAHVRQHLDMEKIYEIITPSTLNYKL